MTTPVSGPQCTFWPWDFVRIVVGQRGEIGESESRTARGVSRRRVVVEAWSLRGPFTDTTGSPYPIYSGTSSGITLPLGRTLECNARMFVSCYAGRCARNGADDRWDAWWLRRAHVAETRWRRPLLE